MKRKYREAMRAAQRERDERPDDAEEVRDWYEEWARTIPPVKQSEPNNNQRSQE